MLTTYRGGFEEKKYIDELQKHANLQGPFKYRVNYIYLPPKMLELHSHPSYVKIYTSLP